MREKGKGKRVHSNKSAFYFENPSPLTFGLMLKKPIPGGTLRTLRTLGNAWGIYLASISFSFSSWVVDINFVFLGFGLGLLSRARVCVSRTYLGGVEALNKLWRLEGKTQSEEAEV